MTPHTVSLSARAVDWLDECLDAKLRRRIGQAIDALALTPRPPGCVMLTGEKNVWRVRVGDYRILYEAHDDRLVVLVIRIVNRREGYR
jgi:mRNA interferase RelE/StbE